jgi:hypothetical protein
MEKALSWGRRRGSVSRLAYQTMQRMGMCNAAWTTA